MIFVNNYISKLSYFLVKSNVPFWTLSGLRVGFCTELLYVLMSRVQQSSLSILFCSSPHEPRHGGLSTDWQWITVFWSPSCAFGVHSRTSHGKKARVPAQKFSEQHRPEGSTTTCRESMTCAYEACEWGSQAAAPRSSLHNENTEPTRFGEMSAPNELVRHWEAPVVEGKFGLWFWSAIWNAFQKKICFSFVFRPFSLFFRHPNGNIFPLGRRGPLSQFPDFVNLKHCFARV